MLDFIATFFLIGRLALPVTLTGFYKEGSKSCPAKIFNIKTDAEVHFILLFSLLFYSLLFWFVVSMDNLEELISTFRSTPLVKWVLTGYYVFTFITPIVKLLAVYQRIMRPTPIVKFTEQECLTTWVKKTLCQRRKQCNRSRDLKDDLEYGVDKKGETTPLPIPTDANELTQSAAEILVENSTIRRNLSFTSLNIRCIHLVIFEFYFENRMEWQSNLKSIFMDYWVLFFICSFLTGWLDILLNLIEARMDIKTAEFLLPMRRK